MRTRALFTKLLLGLRIYFIHSIFFPFFCGAGAAYNSGAGAVNIPTARSHRSGLILTLVIDTRNLLQHEFRGIRHLSIEPI